MTLPLMVELGLIAILSHLQSEAETQLERTEHARSISDMVNRTSKHAFDSASAFGAQESIEDLAVEGDLFQGHVKTVRDDFAELKRLTAGNREQSEVVEASRLATESVLTTLLQIKQLRVQSQDKPLQKQLWKRLRHRLPEMISDDLLELGRKQQSAARESTLRQSELRKMTSAVMLCGGCATLLITALVAAWLVKGLTQRLATVEDNTYRLASGIALNSPLTGQDEIARIDRTFQQMATELTESRRKERAMFDQAKDLICSLSQDGRFTEVNPACYKMLGITDSELLGMYIVDLARPEEVSTVLEYIEQMKRHENVEPLEFALRHKNGMYVDLLWSASWSDDNQSLFSVFHDVSAWKQAQRLKQEVVAMVSHDLRTPLNTIANVLDLLQRGIIKESDAGYKNHMMMARRNSDRMLALMNDFLDMEKIKSGRMSLDLEAVSLDTCFTQVSELLEGNASDRQVDLSIEHCGIEALADANRIQRVLYNLVSNAIKFSPPGTTVTMSATREDDVARVSVRDQGRGVPPDQLSSIFERYQQVSSRDATAHGGSGLGLAICKDIVTLHGGRIWAESIEGEGSTFIFTLQLSGTESSEA